jgi:hypothetical protein
VEPHGDGNQRLFITVPERRATIPCRAYRVPSCMPSSIQRSISGPSIDRSCHLAASSGYLQLLGFQAIAHARKAGCGHARVPLLIRKGLMSLGRIELWGVTARSRQLHTDKVLHGTIKTAVVGRQRYKRTAVNTLDCINIKRSKDWDEATTLPDAARITTIRGTIRYIAADDHLKLLRT